jgi:rSAM/selenodomain-associated transferase 1
MTRRGVAGDRPRIALFARYPAPGAAKTRLIPALGADGAARLHRRLVEETLAVVRASRLEFAVHATGAPLVDFADWLGPAVPLVAQGEGDLGARLARVATPCVLIGADCPDLLPAHLLEAAAALAAGRAAVGPAEDGGYWLLALPQPVPGAFVGIDWGSDRVFAQTLPHLENPVVLARLADCDRPEDLARWPRLLG